MSTLRSIALIGGDQRQHYIGEFFSAKGYDVYSFSNTAGFNVCCSLDEILRKCRIVVLPVPAIKNGSFLNSCSDSLVLIKELYDKLNCIHIVFGGYFSKSMKDFFEENNIPNHDFLTDKSVSYLNTIATAEGAIMEAIKESSGVIHGSECLVTGFGKSACSIALRLKGLNANVTISARRHESCNHAFSLGYNTVNILNLTDISSKFDYIFNTVPAPIITPEIIDTLSKNCLIIDIASYPGGTDFDYARQKGIKALLKLSLPGRISPRTSGNILSDCIEHFIKERT